MDELWRLVSPFQWGWPDWRLVVAVWLVLGFLSWLFGWEREGS